MKQIINGKRYDTTTATEVAKWWNGLSYNDFGFCHERLFVTKNGNWFLEGEGGARSKYAQTRGTSQCGGGAIVPMTKDEARGWLESKSDVLMIEKYFPEDVTDA